jgi:hypothetical protein
VTRAVVTPFLGLLACCTPIDTSCPTGLAASLAAYAAEKVPLDAKSDCAGASRVPLNDPMSIEGFGGAPPAPAPTCDADPNGTACDACLVAMCCAATLAGCPDADSPAACWQTAPAVRACYLDAMAGGCAATCPRDAGAGGGGS